jgi:hypothetical protein
MLTLSHIHQLFSLETCQAYIHALRWKDRPLQTVPAILDPRDLPVVPLVFVTAYRQRAGGS